MISRRTMIGGAAGAVAAGVLTTAAAACGGADRSGGSSPGPRALVTGGEVRGRWENGQAVFRGISYAQAPVGSLRFAAPAAPTLWTGVRDAVEFGPPAPQTSVPATSDDWLTVNVWTPNLKAVGLPVMVWIHGGGYVSSSSSEPDYDGAPLASSGVVVVSLNYRLGVEGFAHILGAPANRGLLDQTAALDWVKRNIAAFGGDPSRVTVFGESAGAGSITALLTMPAAAGLFHRAIIESSVAGLYFTPELATDIGTTYAAQLGLQPTKADLAALPPARLVEAMTQLQASGAPPRWGRVGALLFSTVFWPVVDGTVLPQAPLHAIAQGASRGIDLVVGHTSEEWRYFIVAAGGLDTITPEQSDQALRTLSPGPDGPNAYRQGYPNADHRQLYELVHSDWALRMPSLRIAEAHSAARGTSYLYEYRYNHTPDGAGHGTELPLVFDTLATASGTRLFGTDPAPEVRTLGEEMRRAWTNFAIHGDPGWPAYHPDGQPTRLFDTPTTTADYPETASQRIWADFPFDPLPLTST
ncbi:carboxylesterase/lipase family protein [Nocardia sp. NPDC051570]|uniref:carboxylesterase/lipase family protein n=1 Tax=Nocardia sp. NPDC051570 TaxID=3364324 RepID=UPI0037BAEC01